MPGPTLTLTAPHRRDRHQSGRVGFVGLADRVADLKEEARDLHRRSRAASTGPKRLAGFRLGLAGAAWASISGDPITGVVGALGAGLAMLPDGARGSVYSSTCSEQRSSCRSRSSR
jgi:hypothetical protein